MLLAGFHDSGKETFGLLPLLTQDCQDRSTGIVVVATRDKLPKLASLLANSQNRPCLYFDPAADNCPFFNPLAGPEQDVIEAMAEAILDTNPDLPQYFKDIYAQVLRNVIKVLKRLDRGKGIDGYFSTLAWMSRVLQNNGGQGRELVQRFSKIPGATEAERQENADIANWFLREYFTEFSKIFEGASGLRTQINALNTHRGLRGTINPDTEKGEYDSVDFTTCVKDGGVICISTAEDMLGRHAVFLSQMLMARLRSTVLRSGSARLALYICNANPLFSPSLLPLLENDGTAVHLSLTASGELALRLGKHTGRQFIERTISGMHNVAVFPGLSGGDARMYLDQLSAPDSISATDVSYQPYGSALCRFVHNGVPTPPQFVDLRGPLSSSHTFVDMSNLGHPAFSEGKENDI